WSGGDACRACAGSRRNHPRPGGLLLHGAWTGAGGLRVQLEMKMDATTFHQKAGFTLLELLVVLGLAGLLTAGIGLAVRGGPASASLDAAQSLVAGLLTSARTQAALSRVRARVLVRSANPANPE